MLQLFSTFMEAFFVNFKPRAANCNHHHSNLQCTLYRVSQKKRTFRIVWDMCEDQIFWLFWLFWTSITAAVILGPFWSFWLFWPICWLILAFLVIFGYFGYFWLFRLFLVIFGYFWFFWLFWLFLGPIGFLWEYLYRLKTFILNDFAKLSTYPHPEIIDKL